jgi:aspartate racemase
MRNESEHTVTQSQTRRVGLIGGMSWPSTALYYERLNRALERRCGPHQSFDGVVWNLNYATLYAAAQAGDWKRIETMICDAGRGLARAGCDVVVLTAVTAHLFAEQVAQASGRPGPHVLAGAADELDRLGVSRVGVLGTASTCGAAFLGKYIGRNGRKVMLLDPARQDEIDALIQSVLTTDGARTAGGAVLQDAAAHLRALGAQAVVLACTELPLLLPIPDIGVPIIDSVALHVEDICNAITSNNHAG